jgi:hypothetical protein
LVVRDFTTHTTNSYKKNITRVSGKRWTDHTTVLTAVCTFNIFLHLYLIFFILS